MSELLSEDWLDAVASAASGVSAHDATDGVALITVSRAPAGSVAVFHVVVSSGQVTVLSGRHPHPDMVLGWSYEDFSAACQGDLSLEAAYMSGRMKLEGDLVLLFDGWRPLLRSPELQAAVSAVRDGC